MQIKKPQIHFIMTGGTIDSYYDGTKDTTVPYKKSIIPDYIRGIKLRLRAMFTQICMKDSRDLTIKDMSNVRKTIEKSKYKHFLITHGTYCMPDTARYLEARLKRKDCVVLFTASFAPLASFINSDAAFNLGFSIAKITSLEPGIYVCMNGTILEPGEIAKLISQGRFVSIFENKR